MTHKIYDNYYKKKLKVKKSAIFISVEIGIATSTFPEFVSLQVLQWEPLTQV